jgi:hypothetical protein
MVPSGVARDCSANETGLDGDLRLKWGLRRQNDSCSGRKDLLTRVTHTLLERDLMSPTRWQELCAEMPDECRQAVGQNGVPTGIGRNDTVGWFILCNGQGSFLVWSEK